MKGRVIRSRKFLAVSGLSPLGLAVAVAVALALGLFASNRVSAQSGRSANADRIAVLVTDWGTPEGFSPNYYYNIGYRSRTGMAQTRPDEPCTEGFVGTFPFRSQIGVYPFAIAFPVKGLERPYDSFGIYRRSPDGARFLNIVDPAKTLDVAGVDPRLITPIKDVPPNERGRTVFKPDTRDGRDHLKDVVQIAQPNGVQDEKELDVAYWQRVVGILTPGVSTDLNPMTRNLDASLHAYLKDAFGDLVETRTGMYEAIEGKSRREEDVAVDFAKEGFRRMVITRETTDNNNYANMFATRSWIDYGLCQAGFKDQIRIEQIKQVGRTPEYNTMLMKNLERYLSKFKAGSEVSIVYVTYGLPWPGGNPSAGPFSAPHPWIAEVYHENAFNNFLAFKRKAEATFGKRWKLNFNKSGGMGGPDARTRSLYAYGIFPSSYYGDSADPLRFPTIRETLEHAIRVDGRKQIVLMPSHWYYNGLDTSLAIRDINDLPLNTAEEMKRGEFAVWWCESYRAAGQYAQRRSEPAAACEGSESRIVLTEAFDDFESDFFTGYNNRIRGGIERYGRRPGFGIEVAATGAISKRDGGLVSVKTGPLAGASLLVRKDAHPEAPQGYTWAKAYKLGAERVPAYTEPDAIRPFNEFARLQDHLESAWGDFEAFIGTQALIAAAPRTPLPRVAAAVSPAVLVGPYRTLVNQPAEVTLPFDRTRVRNPRRIQPMIFNEVTKSFEPVLGVPGGSPPRVDVGAGRVSFDTQVFGIFVLVEEAVTR
jgi:hypothetical protein